MNYNVMVFILFIFANYDLFILSLFNVSLYFSFPLNSFLSFLLLILHILPVPPVSVLMAVSVLTGQSSC